LQAERKYNQLNLDFTLAVKGMSIIKIFVDAYTYSTRNWIFFNSFWVDFTFYAIT